MNNEKINVETPMIKSRDAQFGRLYFYYCYDTLTPSLSLNVDLTLMHNS